MPTIEETRETLGPAGKLVYDGLSQSLHEILTSQDPNVEFDLGDLVKGANLFMTRLAQTINILSGKTLVVEKDNAGSSLT